MCEECGRTVATKGSNTSSLLSHLRNSHPTIYSRIKGNTGSAAAAKRSQQTLAGSFAKVTQYARNSKKWEKLTDAVTFCLAKDIMPIYSVEKHGFQQLMKKFDPQYELPRPDNRQWQQFQSCKPSRLAPHLMFWSQLTSCCDHSNRGQPSVQSLWDLPQDCEHLLSQLEEKKGPHTSAKHHSVYQNTLCLEPAQQDGGSEQKMVVRILEQESALRQVLSADQKTSHLIPSWQDIDVRTGISQQSTWTTARVY